MSSKIALACVECGERNYTATMKTDRGQGRLELKKFCKHCNTHTTHKETK